LADNPNIKVTADTSQAMQALHALSDTMNKMSKSIQNSAKGFGKIGQSIQDFGDNLYSAGSKLTAGLSLPLAGIGKTMIEAGANLQAFEATYKQSFKGLASSATKWAGTTAKAIGYTDTQVRQQLLSFNQYGKAMGMTGTTALDFSKKMVTLTDDLAAFYDVDPTEATDRMKSALMGNFEAVDKLGLAFGESTIKGEMLREGLKGQYADLDSAKKMWVLYNLAIKQSADAQGQASRESDQFQAQMQNIKGQLQELAYKGFSVLQPEIQDFLDKIKSLIARLQKLSPEQIKTLAHVAEFLIVAPFVTMYLGIIISSVGRLIKLMKDIVGAIGWMTDFKKRSADMTKAWSGFSKFFTKTIPNMAKGIGGLVMSIGTALGPVGIAILALVDIVALVAYEIYKHWDTVKEKTIEVWNDIGTFLAGVWTEIVGVASTIWGGISGFFAGLWAGIVGIFQTYIAPIGQFFSNLFSTIGAGIMSFASMVAQVIMAIAQPFLYLWNDVLSPIGQFIGGFFVALGQLVVWVFQQVIGTAINWLATQWNWFYSSVIAPVGQAIGSAISAVGQSFIMLWTNYAQPAITYIQALWAGLCQAFQSSYSSYIVPVINAFISAWNGVKSAFNAVVQTLKSIWQGFVQGLMSTWNAIGVPFVNAIKSVWSTVSGTWSSALAGIRGMWSNFIGGLKSAWNSFKSWFKLPHLSISGSWDLTPPDISVPHFNIDWYAKGGIFNSPTVIGVGEAGKEMALPLNKKVLGQLGTNIMASIPDNLKQDSTSSVEINVANLVVREEADVKKIGQELYRLQQRENRARGRSRF